MKRSIKTMFGVVLGLVVVLGMALVANGDLLEGRLSLRSKPLPAYDENKCYDTDGGINYDVSGNIIGKKDSKDFCNGNVLKEFYCNLLGKGTKLSYTCPHGCKNGACKPQPAVCYDGGCNNKPLDFVIVTRPMFVDALKDFINWKLNEFDFNVGVFTLEYVNDNYSGDNIFIKLKNGIQSLVKNSSAKYFLLVGDTYSPDGTFESSFDSYNSVLEREWDIPTGLRFKDVYNFSFTENTPTDEMNPIPLYHSDLPLTSDLDWILDYKSLAFCSVEGIPLSDCFSQLVYTPNAFLGRWPVGNIEELKNIIWKTMNTEKIGEFISFVADEFTSGEGYADGVIVPYPDCEVFPSKTATACYSYLNTLWMLLKNYQNTFEVVELDDEQSALEAKNQMLSTPSDALFYEWLHGYFDSIGFYSPGFIPEEGWLNAPAWLEFQTGEFALFENIFPLAILDSCKVMLFYEETDDSFGEALISAEKGPAVVLSANVYYHFVSGILAGKSVGEAYYSQFAIKNNGIDFLNHSWLFGDPSLILFK